MMQDHLSENPSGSRFRSHSDRSARSVKSQGSSRSGSQRSNRSVSAAHVTHPEPSTPTKMGAENVSTKRAEPAAPTVDLTFDSPDNKKTEKQPKKEGDTVAPYPLNPMIGSAMNASSSSAAGADAPMQDVSRPSTPLFRCFEVRQAR